jgi:hypothetical protein
MRIALLSSLTLALGAAFSLPAHASYDQDACSPNWSLTGDGHCNNVPFLNPGNDSRANLRLLLSDQGALPLNPAPLSDFDREAGYGPVPFDLNRLDPAPDVTPAATPDTPPVSVLDEPLRQLGISQEIGTIAGNEFVEGEGSRCRSNNEDSAAAFLEQLLSSPQLPADERQALANSRLQMLTACSWEPEQQNSLLPSAIQSEPGKAFLAYLRGAAGFYNGRFTEASQQFALLADSNQPWLKETALYMTGRIPLNAAQADAFDDMGLPTFEHVDNTNLQLAEQGFERYLQTYPQGEYSASAKGLIRRVHWLAGDNQKLADDYTWQLTKSKETQRNKTLPALVEEVDSKLLNTSTSEIRTPLLLAINDLMAIGAYQTPFTLKGLQTQKAVFAQQPALYDYLQAAVHLYIEKNPEQALKILPGSVPDTLDYLAFSQQFLRGLALHEQKNWTDAETLWLELLSKVKQPLQREQVELALAFNYERSERLAKVFAADSPIKTPAVRYRLQRLVADAPLLRQQISQGADATERDSALFILLYKELLRGQYPEFSEDIKQLPAEPSAEKLGVSLGYFYGSGQPLTMFRWQGDKAESGYSCPTITETAAALQADGKNPKSLNCLGEFILRNSLDDTPLEAKPYPAELGATPSAFKGEIYSRHEGYRQVIANTKAPKEDRAYALFRAINCYAPSGNNSCGGKDVDPAARKAWFRQLKSAFADTQWGKSLQYYW